MTDRPSRTGVKDTYEEIAAHFSQTREYPWPEVEAFVSTTAGVGVGLDVGCGNGRHVALLADAADLVVGVDVSRGLLVEARDRVAGVDAARLAQADALSLPVRSDSVDVAVYVATLHHLPERELRVASLDEIERVVRPGGRALVSAWSTEHDRFEETTGFDTTVEWTLPGGDSVDRFYHIYDPGEFRADLEESRLAVDDCYVSSGNCYAELSSPG